MDVKRIDAGDGAGLAMVGMIAFKMVLSEKQYTAFQN